MGYDWLDIALAKLRDIEPYEVMQALAAKRRLPVPGLGPGGLPVLGIWARTNAGRALAVVVRHRGNLNWEILGARSLNEDELAVFERWEETQR